MIIQWISNTKNYLVIRWIVIYPIDITALSRKITIHWTNVTIHCMSIYPMRKETSNLWKPAVQLFSVAVDGCWSDWSKWSQCTRNVNGIQMRTRRCVNPKPQFGGKLCTGFNATAMRGCTNISRCRQGIWQIVMNNFVYYPSPSELSRDQYR